MSTQAFDATVKQHRAASTAQTALIAKINALLAHAEKETKGMEIQTEKLARDLLEALFAQEMAIERWYQTQPGVAKTGSERFSDEILLGTRGAGWLVRCEVESKSGSPAAVVCYYWCAPGEYENER